MRALGTPPRVVKRLSPRNAVVSCLKQSGTPPLTRTERAPGRHLHVDIDERRHPWLNGVHYLVGAGHGFERVPIANDDIIAVTDVNGEVLVEHIRPGSGITYVGD